MHSEFWVNLHFHWPADLRKTKENLRLQISGIHIILFLGDQVAVIVVGYSIGNDLYFEWSVLHYMPNTVVESITVLTKNVNSIYRHSGRRKFFKLYEALASPFRRNTSHVCVTLCKWFDKLLLVISYGGI